MKIRTFLATWLGHSSKSEGASLSSAPPVTGHVVAGDEGATSRALTHEAWGLVYDTKSPSSNEEQERWSRAQIEAARSHLN